MSEGVSLDLENLNTRSKDAEKKVQATGNEKMINDWNELKNYIGVWAKTVQKEGGNVDGNRIGSFVQKVFPNKMIAPLWNRVVSDILTGDVAMVGLGKASTQLDQSIINDLMEAYDKLPKESGGMMGKVKGFFGMKEMRQMVKEEVARQLRNKR
jgi:hypothetical protein